ncbi:calcium-dependent protein kinase 16 [Striga asiatica]|uniref:Calcium-dependent protein kinase 16 n=1 Tax=Striga asiatica TaxID=4170 RepID=A0A5A7QXY2_STRAF|nr:calcium-dependent protein kinase 16 [Striga asiatica]
MGLRRGDIDSMPITSTPPPSTDAFTWKTSARSSPSSAVRPSPVQHTPNKHTLSSGRRPSSVTGHATRRLGEKASKKEIRWSKKMPKRSAGGTSSEDDERVTGIGDRTGHGRRGERRTKNGPATAAVIMATSQEILDTDGNGY